MKSKLFFVTILIALEAVAAIFVFQVSTSFECRATDLDSFCRIIRGAYIRGLCLFLGVALYFGLMRRKRHAELDQEAGRLFANRWWLLHLLGLCVAFLPWLAVDGSQIEQAPTLYLSCLLVGGVLALVGLALWFSSFAQIKAYIRAGGHRLALISLVAFLIPDATELISPFFWEGSQLARATFSAVGGVLIALYGVVYLDPDQYIIGVADFFVQVAHSCSGVEGFSLTTGFLVIYFILMRRQFNQARFWLVLFPVAILISWIFNVLRIAILVLIGAFISPELAINGFHSFGGWIAFSVLAVCLVIVANRISWLHSTRPQEANAARIETETAPDKNIAYIVPFIIFLMSSMLAQAIFTHPELGYPFQFFLMCLGLLFFWRIYRSLSVSLDFVAILAGIVVAMGWLLTAESFPPSIGLQQLGAAAFFGWVVLRVIGTSVLVPIIEEAFFRGYLLSLFDTKQLLWRIAAIAVSSLSFALLHGRILEAGIAGVIFCLVYFRNNKVADAITAHAVANAIIAAYALYVQDFSLI